MSAARDPHDGDNPESRLSPLPLPLTADGTTVRPQTSYISSIASVSKHITQWFPQFRTVCPRAVLSRTKPWAATPQAIRPERSALVTPCHRSTFATRQRPYASHRCTFIPRFRTFPRGGSPNAGHIWAPVADAHLERHPARLLRGSARFPAAEAQMPVTYGHRSRMHIWNAIPHVCSAVLHICPPRMHICGSHMGSCRGHVVTGHVVSGHVVAVTSSPAVAQVPRPYCSPPASANSAGASSAWKARSCLGA